MSKHDQYLNAQQINIDELRSLIDTQTTLNDLNFASAVSAGIPCYRASELRQRCASQPECLKQLQSEWHWIWEQGPGVMVIQGAFDASIVDAASEAYLDIIEAERGKTHGDHFAKPGSNDRSWNTLEKMALLAPDVHARYYANDMLAWACEAWLGPAYQITSQVNIVNPGGAAQVAHRDYHLGFMTPEHAARYPASVHRLSAHLTLQSVIAHVDMSIESGPTMLLPHSQKFSHGYLLADTPEFHELFAQRKVQMPLKKGDLVMLSPALLHAAGANHTANEKRMANLLQISSAFARAMETVDRSAIAKAVYPYLLNMFQCGVMNWSEVARAVAATAEGYAFPTNLDRDPPVGGLAPMNQQALMLQSLKQALSATDFDDLIDAHALKRQTS